ncbi:uncharacterized protein LOC108022036 [Drosophila biarmipes]|uniref:uncharacterized protein LOC108022036 n=1 Tax=Drosophila biarmipes TaxID=125945 RepID=UPI0007E65EA5|nr:uncharacterized protein LOC108022036 [Drosophila biarmipes]
MIDIASSEPLEEELSERKILRCQIQMFGTTTYSTSEGSQSVHPHHEILSCKISSSKSSGYDHESRQKFWLPHAWKFLNKVTLERLRCIRGLPKTPQMGQLPPDRLTPYVWPFTHTEVDLFGPLTVSVGRRHEKRWTVIFTCITCRATHLELAANLSTDAFIIYLRNFVNRRGTPIIIRSDNGTNLIGANNELKVHESLLDLGDIAVEAAQRGIKWIVNCSLQPNSGGCWERLI